MYDFPVIAVSKAYTKSFARVNEHLLNNEDWPVFMWRKVTTLLKDIQNRGFCPPTEIEISSAADEGGDDGQIELVTLKWPECRIEIGWHGAEQFSEAPWCNELLTLENGVWVEALVDVELETILEVWHHYINTTTRCFDIREWIEREDVDLNWLDKD